MAPVTEPLLIMGLDVGLAVAVAFMDELAAATCCFKARKVSSGLDGCVVVSFKFPRWLVGVASSSSHASADGTAGKATCSSFPDSLISSSPKSSHKDDVSILLKLNIMDL